MFQDISKIKWSNIDLVSETVKIKDALGIPADAKWVLPQLLAFVATLPLARDNTGKLSFKESAAAIGDKLTAGAITFSNGTVATAGDLKGIFTYLHHRPRGDILPSRMKQLDPEGLRYSAGVPLVLSAFKEYRDIGYNEWNWDSPDRIFLDEDFKELVPFIRDKHVCQYSEEELLAITDRAAVVKSGSTAGTIKPLNTIVRLNKIGDEKVDNYNRQFPSWVMPMFCQTWVFQPHLAHKYSITRLDDLDAKAPPLRGDLDLFKPEATKTVSRKQQQMAEAHAFWSGFQK